MGDTWEMEAPGWLSSARKLKSTVELNSHRTTHPSLEVSCQKFHEPPSDRLYSDLKQGSFSDPHLSTCPDCEHLGALCVAEQKGGAKGRGLKAQTEQIQEGTDTESTNCSFVFYLPFFLFCFVFLNSLGCHSKTQCCLFQSQL